MQLNALVIDANILISALLKDSFTRKILLGFRKPKLFAPEFIIEELSVYLPEFAKRLKVRETELKISLEQLLIESKLRVVSRQVYSEFMEKSVAISTDAKDAQYFALAMKLVCPIWSQDLDFKSQSAIKIYSTKELLEKFL